MANEAQITSILRIVKGSMTYQSQPSSFMADVDGEGGPTPGAILVSTAGTNIDLSQLTVPGLCRIQNLDTTNYVQYGIWDPETEAFYPLGELLPGETFSFRLARDIQEQYGAGTGTGTGDAGLNRLRFKAIGDNCIVLIEAFEA